MIGMQSYSLGHLYILNVVGGVIPACMLWLSFCDKILLLNFPAGRKPAACFFFFFFDSHRWVLFVEADQQWIKVEYFL